MAVAVSTLPSQQLAALNEAYRKAVARKRLRVALAAVVFAAVLGAAGVGAEVNLRTLFTYFGNFVSYFDRIFTLDDGQRVWTNFPEWFWGWKKWLRLLGETLLISYVGTLVAWCSRSASTSWPLKTRRRLPGSVLSCVACSNSLAPYRPSCLH